MTDDVARHLSPWARQPATNRSAVPTTEAGRRLLDRLYVPGRDYSWLADHVRLIEAEAVAAEPRWWILADVIHARNESISEIAGACNHRESPPECIRDAQSLASAYRAAALAIVEATDER